MTRPTRLVFVVWLVIASQLSSLPDSIAAASQDNKDASADESTDTQAWDIERPPGPQRQQSIDATEGTWINLDVSPDGTQIVFDFLGDLYLMPIAGADGSDRTWPQKLTSGYAWDMQPRFSPDGRKVAFTSDRAGKSNRSGDNIWTLDLASKEFEQVTNETFRLLNAPAWSPDGEYIVARKHFSSRRSLGAGEMWMYHRSAVSNNATSGLQLTKRPTDQKDVNEPVFSPDGRYLYYSQDATPGDTFEYDKDSHKQIYVVKRLDLQTGETDSYITGPGGACRPIPSPDGRQLAFVRRVGAKTGLHLFDFQSGAVRLVYDALERDMQEAWAIHGVYPSYAWTPDGKSIVVWAKGKIRRIDIASGEAAVIPFRIRDERTITESLRFPIEVAPEQFDVKMLRWVSTSPDSSHVVYQALGYLYVKQLPDGTPRRLTGQSDHFEFCPSFSRDGQHIVYTTWNDQHLGRVRVASLDSSIGENWVVTAEPGHYAHPVFSPDGKSIVYQRIGGGYLRSPLWARETGLYRVGTRGGPSTRMAKQGSRPQFADHSERVFYTKSSPGKDADNRQLCSSDMNGHDERIHYSSPWATDFQVSPDGKHLAFIERFNVYLAPLIQAGGTINVGPQATGLPVQKISRQAGDFVHFSGDGQRLYWSLGPDLYASELARLADKDDEPTSMAIGFEQPHTRPDGRLALVGGRIITMAGDEVIENGTILINGNRIEAVGPRREVTIPEGTRVVRIPNQIVMPGFIDTHAHGPQATQGITPQRNWVDYARLAFGVTTIHDPSNDTQSIFAASEMTKAGLIVAPRTFSTGTILYGATGSFKAEVDSLDDARFHLKRMKAVGAFSVKSYNQPRRDQRQQVLAAARELEMMVVPEGGSTFMHNLTMIVDGHTGIEHTLPVQTAYDDVMDLWRGTNVGYTPTLSVAYGGISGEQYWYQVDDLWLHPRLQSYIPPHVLNPRSRRRAKNPLEDYNHIRVAEIARQVVDDGGLVQAGGHGQLNGICTHWEMWSFVQGGMTPLQALRCGTLLGARYLGLDNDLGSIEPGKLADIIVIQKGSNPTRNIRHSERIEYVVANGRIFAAERMNELGDAAPRPTFYWGELGPGISTSVPRVPGCTCHRPGAVNWASPQR